MSSSLIITKWILNNRGLLVYENPMMPVDDQNSEIETLRLEIFTSAIDFKENARLVINISEKYNTSADIYCIVEKFHDDIFIVWLKGDLSNDTNNLNLQDQAFKELHELREKQINRFKGILFIDFLDEIGPETRYNSTGINEDDALRIGLQCFTTLGIGTHGNFQQGFHGPLQLPDQHLSTLIYGFIRPAPTSKDSRMRKSGRPAAILLLYESTSDAQNVIVRDFIESLLERNELNKNPELSDAFLNKLLEEIRDMTLFGLDLTAMEQVHNYRLTQLVRVMQEEITTLKERIQKLEEENLRLGGTLTKDSNNVPKKKQSFFF